MRKLTVRDMKIKRETHWYKTSARPKTSLTNVRPTASLTALTIVRGSTSASIYNGLVDLFVVSLVNIDLVVFSCSQAIIDRCTRTSASMVRNISPKYTFFELRGPQNAFSYTNFLNYFSDYYVFCLYYRISLCQKIKYYFNHVVYIWS